LRLFDFAIFWQSAADDAIAVRDVDRPKMPNLKYAARRRPLYFILLLRH